MGTRVCDYASVTETQDKSNFEKAFDQWNQVLETRQDLLDQTFRRWMELRKEADRFLSDPQIMTDMKAKLERLLSDQQQVELEKYMSRHLSSFTKEAQSQQAYVKLNNTHRQNLDSINTLRQAIQTLSKTKLDQVPVLGSVIGALFRKMGWTSETANVLIKAKNELEANIVHLEHTNLDITKEMQILIESYVERKRTEKLLELQSDMSRRMRKFGDTTANETVSLRSIVAVIDQAFGHFEQTMSEFKLAYATEHESWASLFAHVSQSIGKECTDVARQTEVMLRQEDPDFYSKLQGRLARRYTMRLPTSTSPTTRDAPFTMTMYQNLVAELMDKTLGYDLKGLLLFHDMGTGKTCSIVAIVHSFYKYYSRQAAEEVLPTVLLFVQNKDSMTNYQRYFKMCGSGMQWKLDTTFESSSRSTLIYIMSNEFRPVMRFVIHHMKVVFDDVLLRAMYKEYPASFQTRCDETLYRDKLFPGKSDVKFRNAVVPYRGAIIIDEAHNVVDARDMRQGDSLKTNVTNMTARIVEMIMKRTDLPVVLSTGTPAGGRETEIEVDDNGKETGKVLEVGFGNLLRVMDLVRRPCDPSESMVPPAAMKTFFLSTGEPYVKYDGNLAAEYYFDESPAVSSRETEDPTVVDDKTYTWKQGKRAEFMSKVLHFVSYVTLENDPTKYPRKRAWFPTETSSLTSGHYVVRARLGNTEMPTFQVDAQTTGTNATSVIYVPTHKSQWSKLTPNGGYSSRRLKQYPLPNKWRVLRWMLGHKAMLEKKHFLFHPAKGSQAEVLAGYRKHSHPSIEDTPEMSLLRYLESELDIHEIDYVPDIFAGLDAAVEIRANKYIDFLKSDDPQIRERGEGSARDDELQERADKWYRDFDAMVKSARPPSWVTAANRCVVLRDKSPPKDNSPFSIRETEAILAVYNHPKNKDGRYIRYVFATMAHKEGINVMMTHCVHLLEPLKGRGSTEQAEARVRRMNAHVLEPDVSKWIVHSFVYVADFPPEVPTSPSDPHAFEIRLIRNQDVGTAAGLAVEAIKDASLDCHLFSEYTQRKNCYTVALDGYTPKETEMMMRHGVCMSVTESNLQDGKFRPLVIGFESVPGQGIRTVEECYARHMIPGKLLVYDKNDSILYQLLKRKCYTPSTLSNLHMLDDFDRMVRNAEVQSCENSVALTLLQKLTVGAYAKRPTDTQYRLSLSYAQEPFELYRWIRFNPVEIGNAVLFLLKEKRDATPRAIADEIDKSVASHIRVMEEIERRSERTEALLREVDRRLSSMSVEFEKHLATVSRLTSELASLMSQLNMKR